MTEDYLIQEFHEAGIYLPGERMEVELLLFQKSIITQQEMMHNSQMNFIPGVVSILGAVGKVAGKAVSGFLPR